MSLVICAGSRANILSYVRFLGPPSVTFELCCVPGAPRFLFTRSAPAAEHGFRLLVFGIAGADTIGAPCILYRDACTEASRCLRPRLNVRARTAEETSRRHSTSSSAPRMDDPGTAETCSIKNNNKVRLGAVVSAFLLAAHFPCLEATLRFISLLSVSVIPSPL